MKMNTWVAVVATLSFVYSHAFAWNDTLTHKHITREAIDASSIDRYLQSQLEIRGGKNENLSGMPLEEWLQYGAEMEDDPACRASNHFHNPYLSWDMAGLTDTLWIVDLWCWGFGLGKYPPDEINSNLTWTTGFVDRQNLNPDVMALNQWDWSSARQYFYTYLTGLDGSSNVVAPDEPSRNVYLAKTLQAFGQVMHLLQDVAVPAHVRNDFAQGHSMRSSGPEMPWKWIGNGFEMYVKRNDRNYWFDLSSVKPDIDGMQITDLWDTDQLTESLAPTGSTGLGLAEYTSMNFLSEYSMFNSDFPYPRPEHCVVVANDPPWETNTPLERQYLASVNGHPGEIVNHLAVVSYFEYFTKTYLPNVSSDKIPLRMDDNCYNEYAEKLIPRAIGYSSQLLDYFFRGNLDIKKAYFSYGADMSLSGMSLEFKNISTPLESGQDVEPLAGGRIDLTYRYLPPGERENAQAESRDPVFSYGLVRDIYTVADETDPINAEYVIPQQDIVFTPPIAAGSEEITFKLVYHGALGNEPNAVFAATQTRRSQIAFYLRPDSQHNTNHVYTVSPDGEEKRPQTTGPGINPWYANPTWSRDGRKLAFEKQYCTQLNAEGNACELGEYCDEFKALSDIVVVDTASQSPFPGNVIGTYHIEDTPLCQTNAGCQDKSMPLTSPSFSPEGDRFVALAGGPVSENPLFDALVVFDMSTGAWQYLGGCDKWYTYIVSGGAPAWNPQDDTIAFARMSKNAEEEAYPHKAIYLIGADGENEIQITSDEFHDIQPAWSPDGKWLTFVSNRDSGDIHDIWMVDRSGNNLHKVLDCDQGCASPSFSPDGLSLTFQKGDYIFTSDIWGRNLVQVTRYNADTGVADYTFAPEWSPILDSPTAGIEADPATIHRGESATLTWTSSLGQTAQIDNGIGAVEPSGSLTVAPAVTTTYTLSVTGLGGTTTDSVTVSVD